MVNVVDKVTPKMKSKWGNVNITITPQMWEEIKNGKQIVIGIMDEYTAVISVGEQASVVDEC